MTASVYDMQAEAARIAASRPDAILTIEECLARHPATISKQCPRHASLLHQVASLITSESLPPATITVTSASEVLVDATGENLVENCVRRWCAAIDQPVIETPIEVNGWAATQWSASGYLNSVWFYITGHELHPTPIVDRFGVGLPVTT